MTPAQTLRRLQDGNARFVAGQPDERVVDAQTRASLAQGQAPFAAVLGCSDSRVPPEIVFDQPPGALFVVRVAGNTLGPSELASLEFAVSALGVETVVVMGHTGCGAVTAALDALKTGEAAGHPEHLRAGIEAIRSMLQEQGVGAGSSVDAAVGATVAWSVKKLSVGANAVANGVRSGVVSVLGCVYSLQTGEVVFAD